jgi:hypothetical protein
MGQGLVMPVLSGKIKELFGVDFSGLLKDLGAKKVGRKRSSSKLRALKAGTKKRSQKKKAR